MNRPTPDPSDRDVTESAEFQDVLSIIERVRELPESERVVFESGDSGSADDALLAEPLPTEIGRFQVRRLLGEGGYGLVLLAFDPRLKREIALKIPRSGALLTRELRERFLHEAEAAAALSHPNIVPVYEAGKTGANYFIASKYCPGQSLAAWLSKRDEPVAPRTAAQLVAVLAEAIYHAHCRGVLHRDLKPANILLEKSDGVVQEQKDLAESVRITDFGLARVEQSDVDLTQSGSILGTPTYMSPEQAEGKRQAIDRESDIYSLGTILYELLTGKPPFHGRSLIDTLQAVRKEEPVPPNRIVTDLARDLAAICMKCLEKNPADRYESSHALHQDLHRFLSGETVSARPVSRRERLIRWRRRNPAIALLTATSVALLMFLAVGSTAAALMLAQSNRESVDHLEKAVYATKDAKEKEILALKAVYEARIAQSKAARTSRALGQRSDSLLAIEKAASQIDRLQYGDLERRELRNDYIESLFLADLQPELQWPIEESDVLGLATGPDAEMYAIPVGAGEISIRRLADNEQIQRVRQQGAVDYRTRFSPDGIYLLGRYRDAKRTSRLNIWEIESGQLKLSREIPQAPVRTFDISANGETLAVIRKDKTIELLGLPDFETQTKLKWRADPLSVSLSPDGKAIALLLSNQIDLLGVDSGKLIRSISSPASFHSLDFLASAFSPDGSLIAASGNDHIVRVWNVHDGRLIADLRGHGSQVNSISFHPRSRLLSTSGYDNTTRLWQIDTGREVLQTAGVSGDFSRDGNWLGRRAGRWKFLDPSEFCQRHRSRIDDPHPTGRFGIAPVDGELRIVGIAPSRLLSKSLGKGQACFSPDGKQLIIAREEMGAKTLLWFPVDLQTKDATEDDMVTTVSIGAPRELGVLPRGKSSMAVGNNTVVVGVRSSGRIIAFDSESGSQSPMKRRHPRVASIDLSADQRFVASGTWNGKNVRLWDRRSGDLKSNLPSGNATVQFASDRRHWVTSDSQGYFFRSIESPNEKVDTTISFPRSLPGKIAFSRDGSLFAMTVDLRTVRLCDTKTRLELATLRFGADDEISSLDLSHDGRILTVSTWKCSYTCNLNAIRTQLKRHGLDWSNRAVPMADTNPLVVAIDAGALQERNAEVRNASPTYSCSSSYSNKFPVEAAFKPDANRWHSATDDMEGAWVAVNWDRVCNVRRFEIHEVDDRITGFRIQRQVGHGKEWSDLFVAEDDAISRVKRYASRVETFPGGRRRQTPVFLIRLEKAASASAIRLLITETKPKTGANVSIRRFDID